MLLSIFGSVTISYKLISPIVIFYLQQRPVQIHYPTYTLESEIREKKHFLLRVPKKKQKMFQNVEWKWWFTLYLGVQKLHFLLTWRITLRMSSFTGSVKDWYVPWKHQRTIPPLENIVKRSNIVASSSSRMFLLITTAHACLLSWRHVSGYGT